jgi:exodeoxyribonuclease-1
VPAYWSNFLRFSKKASVTDFATGEEFFALTDFYGTRSYSWMVTVLGVNPDNGSEQIVFCLSSDPGELAVMSDEELVARLSEFPKPVRGMRTNSCPIVLSYEDSPEAIRSAAPALPVLKERAALVRNDKQFAGRLVQAFIRSRGERETSPHVEGRIYDGFAGNEDNAVMDRFHALEWAHRAPLIGQLADERLRSLGQRLIYVEAPHVMSDEERRDYDVAIARRLMAEEGSVPWRTYPQAIAETDGLLADDCGPNAVLLAEFQHYLAGRAEEAASQFSV